MRFTGGTFFFSGFLIHNTLPFASPHCSKHHKARWRQECDAAAPRREPLVEQKVEGSCPTFERRCVAALARQDANVK